MPPNHGLQPTAACQNPEPRRLKPRRWADQGFSINTTITITNHAIPTAGTAVTPRTAFSSGSGLRPHHGPTTDTLQGQINCRTLRS